MEIEQSLEDIADAMREHPEYWAELFMILKKQNKCLETQIQQFIVQRHRDDVAH